MFSYYTQKHAKCPLERKINMSIRTDLAVESIKVESLNLTGITQNRRDGVGCEINEVIVETDEAGQNIGKGKGKYITIETDRLSDHPNEFDGMVQSIADEIIKLAPPNGEVLVIGLGNNDITPDALGPQVINQILATRHLSKELPKGHEMASLRSVSALAPGVLGQTGMEVAEITKAICDKTKPFVVVVIDALACSDVKRLGCTIQLTDTGISPGSGVQNRRKELSQRTLGVPVIAVGVPTVVDMHTIIESITGNKVDKALPNMMVTPRDIDKLIERTAKLVAYSINKAFLPTLTIEDFTALT